MLMNLRLWLAIILNAHQSILSNKYHWVSIKIDRKIEIDTTTIQKMLLNLNCG
jgi:hypothetical protein